MLDKYRYWKCVKQLNNMVVKQKSHIKYVLIIPKTINFTLFNDLNRTFKRRMEIHQYIHQFKKLGCYTIYLTLFTLKERKNLGPIADDISIKIITNCLQKLLKPLDSNIQVVGPNHLKQKFNIISYDSFIDLF